MKTSRMIAFVAFAAMAGAAHAQLRVGAKAPAFSLQAALGGAQFDFNLADALKKGPVVLYFYPKSFTSVCTEEAHLFAEATEQFAALGASVIGVSGDDIDTQRKFSSLECRDKFPVGADAGMKVIKAYDASFAGIFAARVSYVIAPDGGILSVVSSSDAQPHIEGALKTLRAWRSGRAP